MSNLELLSFAKKLRIPHFRGVYMRNKLPKNGPLQTESAIINLDNAIGPGTHWVAYRKTKNEVVYFNSFGDLPPSKEVM